MLMTMSSKCGVVRFNVQLQVRRVTVNKNICSWIISFQESKK